jgi:DNA-binding IclR family transcriptional regulator
MMSEQAQARDDQRYRVEAVTRAVRLLKELRKGPLPLAEIAANAEVPANFAAHALETLARNGLARAQGETWGLGLSWLKIADARSRQIDLRELALPIMRHMRDAVDETVILCVRRGLRRVNIDYVESTQAIRRVTQHGYESPLHIGAAGRALLCGLSQDEVGDYFAQATSSTARGAKLLQVATYIEELGEVRAKGYVQVSGEMTPDTAAVSAPVFDHTAQVIGALTISAPSDRFTPQLEASCVATIKKGAMDLSLMLGYSPA